MATREENKSSRCSICLNDGRNTVARHYCVDCETYFCTRCVKCHILPSLKSHQVNDVNTSDSNDADHDTTSLQNDVPSDSINRLRCTLHQGKLLETYCKDHDEVCCGLCLLVKHRTCTSESIATAAKDFKSSSDMNKFKESLTENLVQCKQETEKRTDNLDRIDKQKLDLIEDVDKYEEKIIAKVKELANISRNEIRSRYEEHKTVLDADIAALDAVIAIDTGFVDKLEQTDVEQLFVLVKTSKTATKDGEMLLHAMKKDWKKREIKYSCDLTLEKHVLEIKSMGRFDNHRKGYSLTCESCQYGNKVVSCGTCGYEKTPVVCESCGNENTVDLVTCENCEYKNMSVVCANCGYENMQETCDSCGNTSDFVVY